MTLEQVSRLAPNLNLYQTAGSVGGASVFMRGIGYADNTVGQDSPIGFYLDGVSSGRIGTAVMQLVEPERVEVLRGPQGTLFGRNTTGGALLITTHTPNDDFGGMVKAQYGRYDMSSVQVRIDSGLLGDSGIKLSAAFRHHQRGGYIDNGLQPSRRDPGAERGNAYFFKAVGEWGAFKATVTADYNEADGVPASLQVVDATAAVRRFVSLSPGLGGGAYQITAKPLYDIANDATLEQHIWARGVAATLEYRVSDDVALKSISAFRGYKRNDPIGNGPGNLRGNAGTADNPRIVTFNGLYGQTARGQEQSQFSQELQVLGSAGDFDYVVGAFYFKESGFDLADTQIVFVGATGDTATDIRQLRRYDVESKSLAGFAQASWRPAFLDRRLELTGGIRWTKDERDFDQTQTIVRQASLDTNNTSFLLSASYQWTDNIMTFARYSTGYRSGGFNVRAAANVNPVFQPEKLKSLEAGFKADLFGKRLRINWSAFYNKYDDLQVAQFVPSTAAGTGGNASINSDATYKGFELEVQAVPIDGLTLSATYGYVDPQYKNYPQALLAGGALTPGCSPINGSAGTPIAQNCADIAAFVFYPKHTATVGIGYAFPASDYGQWSARIDYAWKSRVQYGTFKLPSTPYRDVIAGKGYGLLSGRIALSDIPIGGARAQLALFGDNLTDRRYVRQGIDFGSFATMTFGEPRTVGVEAKIEF